MKTNRIRRLAGSVALALALSGSRSPAVADVIAPETDGRAAPAEEAVRPAALPVAADKVPEIPPALTVRWEGDTLVYASADCQLRIDYLNKGTRSEGQAGTLVRAGQPVSPGASGEELDTPVGRLKHYGDERPQAWSLSGWNFADRKQIKRSEEVVPCAPVAPPAPKEAVTITPSGPEAAAEVAPGQVLRVLLREQAGTGFHWKLEGEARAAVLRFDGKGPPETRGDGALGAPAMVPFSFTAVASGVAELRFVYRRPFEPDRAPEKETVVRVIVP